MGRKVGHAIQRGKVQSNAHWEQQPIIRVSAEWAETVKNGGGKRCRCTHEHFPEAQQPM
jgi:hypothetical protein